MRIAEVVGGPMNGERVPVRELAFSIQTCATGNAFAREHYVLGRDGRYHHVGPRTVAYADAGTKDPTANQPTNRRRR